MRPWSVIRQSYELLPQQYNWVRFRCSASSQCPSGLVHKLWRCTLAVLWLQCMFLYCFCHFTLHSFPISNPHCFILLFSPHKNKHWQVFKKVQLPSREECLPNHTLHCWSEAPDYVGERLALVQTSVPVPDDWSGIILHYQFNMTCKNRCSPHYNMPRSLAFVSSAFALFPCLTVYLSMNSFLNLKDRKRTCMFY